MPTTTINREELLATAAFIASGMMTSLANILAGEATGEVIRERVVSVSVTLAQELISRVDREVAHAAP